ncbi:DUF4858 domain-containing protein [Bacteroides zoogleoformans]|uniref:DUF4858 domain-containing protein n=1 Tax=Bacteroides zoogleoformans TaxID=28119 RepID=UPI00248DA0BF|nr:DUF4858 domain-containing protein [Bacteroides zoogleoformans]
MKRFLFCGGLLIVVAFPFYAQNWTPQDSLRLQQLLQEKKEIKLNLEVLKELDITVPSGNPKLENHKSWMDFDTSIPVIPQASEQTVKLTLRPYTANTRYNWDPIYQKKIKIGKNTWRGDEFYALKILRTPTNWAKSPLDAGPRETVEQIEASGLRYRVTERGNNMAVGGWQGVSSKPSGIDLMAPFTQEFWILKGRKRRARTLEVLKSLSLPVFLPRKKEE